MSSELADMIYFSCFRTTYYAKKYDYRD